MRALSRVIVDAGLAASTSEASRKIQQGGVRLNGERLSDPKRRLSVADLPGHPPGGPFQAVRLQAE